MLKMPAGTSSPAFFSSWARSVTCGTSSRYFFNVSTLSLLHICEHDFKSFCTAKPEVTNTVRTGYSLDLKREDDMITLRIRGNGFLYNMVRIITGTLIRVGGGFLEPEDIPKILEAKDRGAAGETARPEGLDVYKRQVLKSVTIPMVMPSITVCTFLTLTNSFKLFDQNLALTNGEPSKMSEMLALNIFTTFYGRAGYEGVGQAKAVIFFILVAAIALTQNYLTRRKEVQQ